MKAKTAKADLEEAQRWLLRGRLWDSRGFESARDHSAAKAVEVLARLACESNPGSPAVSKCVQEARKLVSEARSLQGRAQEARDFERGVAAIWNGHGREEE